MNIYERINHVDISLFNVLVICSGFAQHICIKGQTYPIVLFLFCLRFYVAVNSYSHVETVSSPNHTFPGQA